MTDPLTIPKGDHRLLWVFGVDLPKAQIPAFEAETYHDDGTVMWPLDDALGLSLAPDHDFIELFDASVMQEYGLARYLSEANGMEIGDDAARLDALTGHVLLVFSQALKPGETAFHLKPPLSLIGRYGLTPPEAPAQDLSAESAQPYSGHPASPPESAPAAPPRFPRAARIVIGVFALLILLVLLWGLL